MEGIGSPKLLFENLDLTPTHPILWTGLRREGPGRPVEYDPECDLKALMLRQLLQIPYVKGLVERLRRNRYLRRVCSYGEKVPTEAHFSQMKKRIGPRASASSRPGSDIRPSSTGRASHSRPSASCKPPARIVHASLYGAAETPMTPAAAWTPTTPGSAEAKKVFILGY